MAAILDGHGISHQSFFFSRKASFIFFFFFFLSVVGGAVGAAVDASPPLALRRTRAQRAIGGRTHAGASTFFFLVRGDEGGMKARRNSEGKLGSGRSGCLAQSEVARHPPAAGRPSTDSPWWRSVRVILGQ